MAPPDVDDLLKLVKAGVDPTLAAKPKTPTSGLDAENLVRLLGESATDPTGEKAAKAFATEGEVATSAKRRLKKLFAKLDVDGSGSIEMPEFRKLLLSSDTSLLGLPTCSLADIFDAVDTDGDDEVDYNEFLDWLGLGTGRPAQGGAPGEAVSMPEVDDRVDGPSSTSSGAACWKQAQRREVLNLARTLGVWRPPDGFEAQMELRLSQAETLCLQLGTCEADLRSRRTRARGAMRRWVADNFSMSSKSYMKKVEEAEKRDSNVKATRARLERDPEAREAAQLAGWTHQQQLGQLSTEHKHMLEDLVNTRRKADEAMERVLKDLTARFPEELFPGGLDAAPLRQVEAIPGLDCSLVASLDAAHVPGEGVVLCVDVQLPDEREKKTPEDPAPHGVDFLLVLDQSASMAEDLALVGRAMETLVDQMDARDRLSVIAMGDEANVLLDWTEMSNSGRKEGKACVEKLSAVGGAHFLPACEKMMLQLKASSESEQSRQAAVLFVSDGDPMEARDAIFSCFSRRLSAFPSLLFAPVALGPEADASLMTELGRCLRGPSFYLPNETQIDEVLGQVLATAGHTALLDCRVVLRPHLGCGLAEVEEPASSCGILRHQEDIPVSPQQLKALFRCVVTFSTESAAFKACKFADSDDEIFLREPLLAGTAGLLTDGKGNDRPLVTTSQRLIGIRRSTFLPKSKKIRENPDLTFEAEEDAPIFERRPANRILWTGISRGTIELEFVPTQWCENDWALAEDVVMDEATLAKGSRLIGYRLGEHGDVQTAEVDVRSYSQHHGGGFAGWRMEVFDSLLSQAAGRGLHLCFDVAYPCISMQTGPLQRGGSRQVFANLRVPKSLESPDREEEDESRRLLDVFVVATSAQPDGTRKVIQQRLSLHAGQVPSLGAKGAMVRYHLKPRDDGEAADEAAFTQALATASDIDAKELQAEREFPTSSTSVLAGPGLSSALRSESVLAATLDRLSSAGVREMLEASGFPLQASPVVVGRAALRRFAQWRLSRCLRAAAEGGSWAMGQWVRELSESSQAAILDPAGPPAGALRSAALEAASGEAASRQCSRLSDCRHRLFGLAAAHEGQRPPSVALDALGLSATEGAWEPTLSPEVLRGARKFSELACVREQVPCQVTQASFAGADGDSLRIRFVAVEGNGRPVTAYTLSARDCETGEVYQQSTRASSADGFMRGREYQASVDGLPSGKPFTVVVFAWNGNRSLPSPPVFCTTPQHALCARGPGRRAPSVLREN